MPPVYIYDHDPLFAFFYSADEVREMFGEEFLDEYSVEVPQELLDRHRQLKQDFYAAQAELRKFKK